jgi:hypothetical protein
MKKRSILAYGAIAVFTFALVAFTAPQDDWEVPAKYKNMENKYAGEDEDEMVKIFISSIADHAMEKRGMAMDQKQAN